VTEEELRSMGWGEDEARRYMAGYSSVLTGDQVTMSTAAGTEVREADPYAGRSDQEVASALAARVPGGEFVRPEEMQAFLANARTETVAKAHVAVAEVTRPGSGPDAFDREVYYRRAWMQTVGREFTVEELAGQPVPGCVACSRMAGAPCDEHARKTGEPIPYPPHPWPSEMAGHTAGQIILRPGQAPYRLDRSVA
jgi:hypothetical protein